MQVRVMFGALALLLGAVLSTGALAQSVTDMSFEDVYARYNELAAEENFAEALPYARRAYVLGRQRFGLADANTGALAYNLGLSALKTGELSLADAHLTESLEIFENAYEEGDLRLLDPLMELGSTKEGRGQYREAVAYLNRASVLLDENDENGRLILAEVQLRIGNLMMSDATPNQGEDRLAQAIAHIEKSKDIYTAAFGADSSQTGLAVFSLGKAYFAQGDPAMAEESFRSALAYWGDNPNITPSLKLTAHSLLISLYEEKGESDRADEHCIAIGHLLAVAEVDGAQPVYRVQPIYPEAEAEAREEGEVLLSFTVTPEGRVINPEVVQQTGSDSFVEAAKAALLQYRYAPAVENGQPVASEGVQTIFNFRYAG